MRKSIHYAELGATLFVPAIHKNISQIISGDKYPNLKSVVIDTEDGIADELVDEALVILRKLVIKHKRKKLLVFIRPKNVDVLKDILTYENIEAVDGFVLPKFSLANADAYLELIKETKHYFMPSIEGVELFNPKRLRELKDKLNVYRDKIILVRFGLEDMLRQLSMKRGCEDSIFDFAVSASILGSFLCIFKSAGFGISGGVYPCFSNMDGFKKDVKRDLKEGLFSKTIIHPSQIDALHEIYRVSQKEFDEAKKILENEVSIINLNGSMGEGRTMSPYAKLIQIRAKIYGIID